MANLPLRSRTKNIQSRHDRIIHGKKVTINIKKAPVKTKKTSKKPPRRLLVRAKARQLVQIRPIREKLPQVLRDLNTFWRTFNEMPSVKKFMKGFVNRNEALAREIIYDKWIEFVRPKITEVNMQTSTAFLRTFIKKELLTKGWVPEGQDIIIIAHGTQFHTVNQRLKHPIRQFHFDVAKVISPFYDSTEGTILNEDGSTNTKYWDDVISATFPAGEGIGFFVHNSTTPISKLVRGMDLLKFPYLVVTYNTETKILVAKGWKKNAELIKKKMIKGEPFMFKNALGQEVMLVPEKTISRPAGIHALGDLNLDNLTFGKLTGKFAYEFRKSKDQNGVRGWDMVVYEDFFGIPKTRPDLSFFFHQKSTLDKYIKMFEKEFTQPRNSLENIRRFHRDKGSLHGQLKDSGLLPNGYYYYIHQQTRDMDEKGNIQVKVYNLSIINGNTKRIIKKVSGSWRTVNKNINLFTRTSGIFNDMFEIETRKQDRHLLRSKDPTKATRIKKAKSVRKTAKEQNI